MTLTEFLLARIGEDEAVAQAAREHEYLSAARDASPLRWVRDSQGYGTVFVNSGRVLAECEAKRQIAELHKVNPEFNACWVCAIKDGTQYGDGWGDEEYPCTTLRFLALPYADHPDYREEWRP